MSCSPHPNPSPTPPSTQPLSLDTTLFSSPQSRPGDHGKPDKRNSEISLLPPVMLKFPSIGEDDEKKLYPSEQRKPRLLPGTLNIHQSLPQSARDKLQSLQNELPWAQKSSKKATHIPPHSPIHSQGSNKPTDDADPINTPNNDISTSAPIRPFAQPSAHQHLQSMMPLHHSRITRDAAGNVALDPISRKQGLRNLTSPQLNHQSPTQPMQLSQRTQVTKATRNKPGKQSSQTHPSPTELDAREFFFSQLIQLAFQNTLRILHDEAVKEHQQQQQQQQQQGQKQKQKKQASHSSTQPKGLYNSQQAQKQQRQQQQQQRQRQQQYPKQSQRQKFEQSQIDPDSQYSDLFLHFFQQLNPHPQSSNNSATPTVEEFEFFSPIFLVGQSISLEQLNQLHAVVSQPPRRPRAVHKTVHKIVLKHPLSRSPVSRTIIPREYSRNRKLSAIGQYPWNIVSSPSAQSPQHPAIPPHPAFSDFVDDNTDTRRREHANMGSLDDNDLTTLPDDLIPDRSQPLQPRQFDSLRSPRKLQDLDITTPLSPNTMPYYPLHRSKHVDHLFEHGDLDDDGDSDTTNETQAIRDAHIPLAEFYHTGHKNNTDLAHQYVDCQPKKKITADESTHGKSKQELDQEEEEQRQSEELHKKKSIEQRDLLRQDSSSSSSSHPPPQPHKYVQSIIKPHNTDESGKILDKLHHKSLKEETKAKPSESKVQGNQTQLQKIKHQHDDSKTIMKPSKTPSKTTPPPDPTEEPIIVPPVSHSASNRLKIQQLTDNPSNSRHAPRNPDPKPKSDPNTKQKKK